MAASDDSSPAGAAPKRQPKGPEEISSASRDDAKPSASSAGDASPVNPSAEHVSSILAASGILDALPAALLIANSDGSLRSCNAAAGQIYGYAKDQLLVHNLDELVPGWSAPASMGTVKFSSQCVHGDGTVFPASVRILRIVGGILLVHIENVQHQHNLERMAKTQQELVESLIQSLPFLVLLADTGGHILRLNNACETMTGFHEEDFSGRTWLDVLVPAEDHQHLYRRMEALRRNEAKSIQIETVLLKRDGRRGLMHWTLCPLWSPTHAVAGTLVIGNDQTNRQREATAQGPAHGVLPSALAEALCHDLQKESTLLEGLAGYMFAKLPAENAAQSAAEQVLASTRRLSHLCKQLAASLAPEHPRLQVVDLNRILAGQTESLARLTGQIVRLSVDLCDEPCRINVDPNRIEQVILAMVAGVCQTMPGGGRLTVETGKVSSPGMQRPAAQDASSPGRTPEQYTGGQIMLAVTGHGYNPMHIGKVAQGDEQAMGMELAVIRRFLQDYGGNMCVLYEQAPTDPSQDQQAGTLAIYLPEAQHASETDRLGETK